MHIPSIPKPGGFTITSSPSSLRHDYIELAVQKSPGNPAAVWLWGEGVVGKEVSVRVGGGFVWPLGLSSGAGVGGGITSEKEMKRVVFIAGGVGINPLMSMLSHIVEQLSERRKKLGFNVVFLYSSKYVGREEGEVLFLKRLRDAFMVLGEEGQLKVFLTGREDKRVGGVDEKEGTGENVEFHKRRIGEGDIFTALGPVGERGGTVVYVCGVPGMTDEFVERVKQVEGIMEGNVLCERWW